MGKFMSKWGITTILTIIGLLTGISLTFGGCTLSRTISIEHRITKTETQVDQVERRITREKVDTDKRLGRIEQKLDSVLERLPQR